MITTIRLTKTTQGRLAELGKKNETYDDLVNRLLDELLEKRLEDSLNATENKKS